MPVKDRRNVSGTQRAGSRPAQEDDSFAGFVPFTSNGKLLQEDSFGILQEDGTSYLLQE